MAHDLTKNAMSGGKTKEMQKRRTAYEKNAQLVEFNHFNHANSY